MKGQIKKKRVLAFIAWQAVIYVPLFCIGMLLAIPASASLTNAYVTQSGAASGGCSSAVHAVSWFNNSANWGTGAGQIGSGTTVLICGTITTSLVAQGNGTSGNPITLQWDTGATLRVCDTNGAVQLPGLSYIVVDLGGNNPAITCPANGSGLSSQNSNVVGITDGAGPGGGSGMSNVEIRNGTIGPLYQYSCCGSDGENSYALVVTGGSGNNHFDHLTFNNALEAVMVLPNQNSSGNEINNNSCASTIARCVDYINGNSGSFTDSGAKIHDNDIAVGTGWESGSADFVHIDPIRSWIFNSSGSTDSMLGILIYNNYLHGAPSNNFTDFIQINSATCGGTGTWSGDIFNNLFVDTATSGSSKAIGDGMITFGDCGKHIGVIANNTFDGGPQGQLQQLECVELNVLSPGSTSVTFENNICMNFYAQIYGNDASVSITSDYNDFYNDSCGCWGANGVSYSSWQSSGNDRHSLTANPNVNAGYQLSVGSPVIGGALNLSGLGISQLDTGTPATFGSAGSCGSGCIARLPSGAWDMGGYAGSSSLSGRPSPPSNLSVVIR